jgi:hypothetical protein
LDFFDLHNNLTEEDKIPVDDDLKAAPGLPNPLEGRLG